MRTLSRTRMAITTTLALVLAAALAPQFGLLAGQRPADLGVQEGRLKPPSETRNSVSSQAEQHPGHPQLAYARIEPFAFKSATGEGEAADALATSMAALRAAIAQTSGVSVVTDRGDYLHAEAQTRWMKFVDDVEFWADPARSVIEVRSASRLGREDFGANRARVEAIRARYLAQP